MRWGRVALLASIACLAASEVKVEATAPAVVRAQQHKQAHLTVAAIEPPPRVLIMTPDPAVPPRSFFDVMSDVLNGRE